MRDIKSVGHLLQLPVQGGKTVLVDPEEITGVSGHKDREDVTLVTARDRPNWTHYVEAPVEEVVHAIAEALQ